MSIIQNDAPKRERSPDYPACNLREAVEAIETLYRKDKLNSIPTEVAAQHLGYTSLNGRSRIVLSALKKFGLIEYGASKIRLTDLGKDIVMPREPSDRVMAISQALTKPTAFARIQSHYPEWQLPSDSTLSSILIRDWGFSHAGVSTFIANLKDSLEYVRVDIANFLPKVDKFDDAEEMHPVQQSLTNVTNKGSQRPMQQIPMPGTDLYLVVWRDMTATEAKKILRWLDKVVKPTLELSLEEEENI